MQMLYNNSFHGSQSKQNQYPAQNERNDLYKTLHFESLEHH